MPDTAAHLTLMQALQSPSTPVLQIVDCENHPSLDILGDLRGRRVRAYEMASAQISQDREVDSIRLDSGNCIEDADGVVSEVIDRFDDLLNESLVLRSKTCAAP
jgi:hypothetical protein